MPCVHEYIEEFMIENIDCKISSWVNYKISVLYTGGTFSISAAKHLMKSVTGLDVGPARKPQKSITQEQIEALAQGIQEDGFVCCKLSSCKK